MFILINNKSLNINNIDSINVVDHKHLIINLSRLNKTTFYEKSKIYAIDETYDIFRNNAESLITFETTFRIQIVLKDKSIIYSKSTNFYTEVDAINKMKELCLLCNTIEASLPKINI